MRKNLKNKERKEGKVRSTNDEVRTIMNFPVVPRTSYLAIPFAPLLALLFILLFGCSSKPDQHPETYTCPMHPTVISDKPSSCPVCGMDLVRKAREGEEVKITEDLARLLKSPNEIVVSSIKTIKPSYKSVPVTIDAQGLVTYDTRSIYTISARVSGRLEKVFLKYVFQSVTKGQKIAEIYSPELITAQRELLYLLENDATNVELIQAAKNKLLSLGVSESHLASLISRKEVSNTFSVYSPYNGYLISDDQQAPSANAVSTSSSPANDMNAMSPSSSSIASSNQQPATFLIREGSYISAGQTLFRIINSSALRIELNLPVSQAGSIKTGETVQLDFGGHTLDKATIDLVQPYFNDNEEFVKLRAYTRSTDDLHIGHFVKTIIDIQSPETLWIPREAVIDLGLNQVALVKERDVFKPRKITMGTKAGNWIEVRYGLSSSDEIASNAQYLIDSESFIKTN